MGSHRTFKITLESTLELFPNIECPISVEANVMTYTDPAYGADADGRRGTELTTVDEVEIHSLYLQCPGRPDVRLFRKEGDIKFFLNRVEFEQLVELVCEKAFREF